MDWRVSRETFGLVNVVEREGDLALAEHVPGSVEQLGSNLRVHDIIDHGLEIGPAVELSSELWRKSCSHGCGSVGSNGAERGVGRKGSEW